MHLHKRPPTKGSYLELSGKKYYGLSLTLSPAAYATISSHFKDLGRGPEDYDRIYTGDLGRIGRDMLLELAAKDGLSLEHKLYDCGMLVFNTDEQDVHSGGSGCGCSAITLCGSLLNQLNTGKLKRILFCGTGALLSPTSTQQGLPIPGVCHGVSILGRSD